ncbi:MAG: hypothetical protein IH889_04090, partial [Planctomycetes bacterium]|nr:hypothetical protein [Planctomycetota bacterium]
KFAEVKELKVMPAGPTLFDSRAPAIEDVLTEIAAEVPDSEWAKLPEDLTDQLDHYLYGTPRQ